jgi:hypothetical protein
MRLGHGAWLHGLLACSRCDCLEVQEHAFGHSLALNYRSDQQQQPAAPAILLRQGKTLAGSCSDSCIDGLAAIAGFAFAFGDPQPELDENGNTFYTDSFSASQVSKDRRATPSASPSTEGNRSHWKVPWPTTVDATSQPAAATSLRSFTPQAARTMVLPHAASCISINI